MVKQLDRLGRLKPVYLSDVLYITPAQILDALSRAERYAGAEKDLEKEGDGYDVARTQRVATPPKPTRLHFSVMQSLDRRKCQQVRLIKDFRSTPIPGWVRVRVFYTMKDGAAEIDQDLPTETVAALSETDKSDEVAARYDRVWQMEDDHLRLKMLLPLVPRLKKNGQPDPNKKTVAPEGYALWHTFPRLKLVRMIHPVERMHDPKRPEYNRVPQFGYIEAWDTGPPTRGMNLKVYPDGQKTAMAYAGADGIHLAGWRVDVR